MTPTIPLLRVLPRPGGLRPLVALLVGFLLLAACATETGKETRQNLVVAIDPVTGEEIVTTQEEARTPKFFSRDNLRETYFSGDTGTRLGNTDGSGPTGFINFNAVNNGPGGARQGNAARFEELRAEDIVVEPLRSQSVIGDQWQPDFKSQRTVTLSYDQEPLRDVIQNVLGGILGVNYVVGDSVEGSLTFRSEQRFAPAELVQMLSDVLARNGYLIQYFNGVYHIGTPDELDTLTGLRSRTGLAGDSSYAIKLRRPPPENIVPIIQSLIPPNNVVAEVPGTNNLLVRGDPSQFKAIEELVMSLTESVPRNALVALYPTRNSPPDAVAEQITAIYESRNLANVMILPVDQAPGILVVADRQSTLNDVGRLTRNLDVENRDAPQIRVIQLKHLDAEQLARQLATMVDGTGIAQTGPANGGRGGAGSNVVQAGIDRANTGQDARDGGGVEGGENVPAPTFIGRDNRGGSAPDPVSSPDRERAAAGITFATDGRNNLLVRSRFGEFKRIKQLVEAMDVPRAQVVIEATIVEVDINDSLQYGVQAFLQQDGLSIRTSTAQGGAADPGGGGFVGMIDRMAGNTAIQAVLSALQSVTNVKVISSPYLTVVDGATSRLAVGDQIPFVTASQTSNSNGTVTVTQEIDAKDVGVILDVTPRISPDNSVFLDITQQVSSARNVDTQAGSNPVIAQRFVQSQITVQSGRTVLLGGLIQERADNSENGVPVLRKIPVLGNAFNRRSNQQTRSELLVMITPRVVRNDNQLTNLSQRLRWYSKVNN
ncbi:secretin N-terminal domain-containing protein [Pseudooceanicola aestuarii]|uniref:secretin N-terminal domain-containing protein n=1 Tax=Pseudooceanicola aestuarii TaxID=2697319 RepID=UPI0013D4BD18|nr:secretin N-terminal domain-containing protein [Pseudooceanicola aestuarii]